MKYGYFQISNGRGMRSIKPVYLIFKKEPFFYYHTSSCQVSSTVQELYEIIEVNAHKQTERHTDRQKHADENITCPKTEFFGQVNINTHTHTHTHSHLNTHQKQDKTRFLCVQ